MSSMLATQLNHMIESGAIDKNTVIRVDAFGATKLGGRKWVSALCLALPCLSLLLTSPRRRPRPPARPSRSPD